MTSNPATIESGTVSVERATRQFRLQRRVAYASVGIPAIGFVVAMVLAAEHGIGWMEVSLLASMYFLTAIGIEGGMHRFFSHHAFKAGPIVTAFFAIAGSMAVQGPVLFWAATHRKHHAFADLPGDPHSPRLHGTGFFNGLRGLWHAHVGWLFTGGQPDWSRYVPDLLADRWVFRLNQYYPFWVLLGLIVPAAIGGAVTGSWEGAGSGLLWGGLVRIFLLDQVVWSVNSFAHIVGRRAYATKCNSGNIAFMSLLSVGGSWHNNHHFRPLYARNDHQPWQLDPSGWFIELLAAFGLVWGVRRPKDKAQAV